MSNILAEILSRKGNKEDSGLAAKAANLLSIDKDYKAHVMASIDDGREPLSKAEYIKSRSSL